MKVLDIYIDGIIGASFWGEDSFSKKDLDVKLSQATQETETIRVHINSPGGIVDEGFAIHDLLVNSGYTIETIIEGMCGSIATVIALAGSVRKIHANSKFFVHPPFASFIERLDAEEAQRLADELKATQEQLINFYVEKTGKDRSEIEPLVLADTTLNSDRAVELNFCTEVIRAKAALTTRHKQFNYITKNQLEMANENALTEKVGGLEAALKSLKALFKTKFKNETGTLSDGTTLFWDGAIEVGKAVYIDEAMETVAPEGTHLVSTANGTVEIVLDAAGVVVSLTEIEALKAEVEALKAEKEAWEAEKNELSNKVEEIEAQITALSKLPIHNQAPAAPATPQTQAPATAQDEKPKFDLTAWATKKGIVNQN